MMIDKLTSATFSDRVGDIFDAEIPEHTLRLELILVRKIASAQTNGDRPFALEFRGPLEPIWPQAIYKLQNQQLGTLDLFLVPVGPDEQGMIYEAVFN